MSNSSVSKEKLSERFLKVIDNCTGEWFGGYNGVKEVVAEVDALEAERDTLKELLKEGWRYKDDMLQWQEYRIWKKKAREFLGVDVK